MLKDKLLKKMKEKGASEMSEPEKAAKMSVLKEMQKMASDAMSGRLNGLKKVEVASDSPEGMEDGLDKAKEIVSQMPDEKHFNDDTNDDHGEGDMKPERDEEHEGDDDDGMEQDEGGMRDEAADDEHEGMSEDELDAKLQKLMALKHKRGMK